MNGAGISESAYLQHRSHRPVSINVDYAEYWSARETMIRKRICRHQQ
jgi:hypothetical protein